MPSWSTCARASLAALALVACSTAGDHPAADSGPDAAVTPDVPGTTDAPPALDGTSLPDLPVAADAVGMPEVTVTADVTTADRGAPEASLPDAAPEAATPDLGADATDAGAEDAGLHCALGADAGGATDGATDAGSSDAAVPTGYIRFLNFSEGVGTVRFVAANQPGFSPSFIEAIVPEGGSSGYIQTLPVSYFIDAFRAAGRTPKIVTDGGLEDGGRINTDASAPPADVDLEAGTTPHGDLAERIPSDVYFSSGCTVILAGSPLGTADDLTDIRLWRLSDVPIRSDMPGVGLVRVVGAVAAGPPVNIDEGPTALAHNVQFFEPLGFRRVCAGDHHYAIRNADDGTVLGGDFPVRVIDGHPHTFYVWGRGHPGASATVHVVVTDDLPPGR